MWLVGVTLKYKYVKEMNLIRLATRLVPYKPLLSFYELCTYSTISDKTGHFSNKDGCDVHLSRHCREELVWATHHYRQMVLVY